MRDADDCVLKKEEKQHELSVLVHILIHGALTFPVWCCQGQLFVCG